MIVMLRGTFEILLDKFNAKEKTTEGFWAEIEEAYSKPGRHYHNLSHLKNLLTELLEVKHEIKNWDAILFSLFYHDIIYNPLKKDNEERSAELAVKRMESLNIPHAVIENCEQNILATKAHQPATDPDTNYFLDADLSILGYIITEYTAYFQNVRKDFRLLPDIIYNPGRKKILQKFLEMERIFKTAHFNAKYEKQARENLAYEIDVLS